MQLTPFRLSALALLCALSLRAADTINPAANLVVEGIPAIPASIAEDVKRYTESRSASFAGWHPTRLELLISTRFGNTPQLHLVSAPMGARKQLTFFDEPVGSGGFDQLKGEFFLFSRDRGGNEFSQLHRYDLADGRVTLLTDGGRSQNGFGTWSPDYRLRSYGSTRRNGADRDIYVMDPRDPKGTDRLVLQVSGGGWGVQDWSPDGRTLLVGEYVSVNESHLWFVDVATGEKREFTPRSEKGVSYSGADFTKDGKGVLYAADRGSEFSRLHYHELATGTAKVITDGFKGDVSGPSLSHDGKRAVFFVSEDGIDRAFLLEIATLAYRPIAGLPAAQLGGGSWHRDNRHVAFNVSSARSVNDVYVLDADTGTVTRWTESELGGLVADQLSEPSLVKWKSFDGLEISGFLYRPPASFTGKRPVIVNMHGGPEGQSLPVFVGRNNYILNELGVAIVFPNVRGSTGYGKTFVALDNGPKREDSVKDIGALLDWIAQQPDLDASRVMVTGGSYGGYMTLACAVHYSDRLRCALDVVGISNFITFLTNTESYRRDLRRVEYGDERDPEMRAIFERISPLNHAEKIKIPMFIVQGANDPRVPRTEAIQMVERVRANGGPVWYLEAKDEGHGFRKKS
ncbi:MAG: peptidase S9, prolyl oligopeptidase, partial [Opitutus sp.]|nr:peptidase S9, prolyl oligopeptidase [Opitutus sp.]